MAGRAAPAPGALLCALLWAAAAAAAAGGGPGDNPAPGAFGRVYRGAVNISAERVYAFAYRSEPGQVGATPERRVPRGGASTVLPSPSRLGAVNRGGAGAAAAPPLCGSGPGSAAVLPASSRRRGGREPQCTCGLLSTFPGADGAPRAAGWEGRRRAAGVPGAAG